MITDDNYDCKEGRAADAFINYVGPKGIALICIGPIVGGYHYGPPAEHRIFFHFECQWLGTCDTAEKLSTADERIYPFEFINVTGLTAEERLFKCCKQQQSYGFTSSTAFFKTPIRRTRVYQERE